MENPLVDVFSPQLGPNLKKHAKANDGSAGIPLFGS
jgi:hypothetical protein